MYFNGEDQAFRRFLVKEGDEVTIGTPLYEYTMKNVEQQIGNVERELAELEGEITGIDEYIEKLTDYKEQVQVHRLYLMCCQMIRLLMTMHLLTLFAVH